MIEELPVDARESMLAESRNEFSISRVRVSIALVAGLGSDLFTPIDFSFVVCGTATLNRVFFSCDCRDNGAMKFALSIELTDAFRDFFFLRGGAIGPTDVTLSVVLECVSLVLAITSGSLE